MASFDPRDVIRSGSEWLDRSAEISRRRAARQNEEFRSRASFIAQCALAAGVALFLAHYVLDVPEPMFAPVAAILTVGMSHGERLKRALEITFGVAFGVMVGELFVATLGVGVWQVVLLVAIGMAVPAWLGASTLMMNQAGIQGMIIMLLAGQQDAAMGRWFEAFLGCCVGLVFSTFIPSSVVRRPRVRATRLLERLASLQLTIAESIEQQDEKLARENLAESRSLESDLETLRGYADDSVDISTYVPWYRNRLKEMRTVATQLEPLDRALRNTRVLMRRSTLSTQLQQAPPESYVEMLRALSRVTDVLADYMRTGHEPEDLRPMMHNLTQRASRPAPEADMAAEVLRAQVRSIIVDYNMLLGDDYTGALAQIRMADDEHVQESKDTISALLDQMEPETHAIPAAEFTMTGIIPVVDGDTEQDTTRDRTREEADGDFEGNEGDSPGDRRHRR